MTVMNKNIQRLLGAAKHSSAVPATQTVSTLGRVGAALSTGKLVWDMYSSMRANMRNRREYVTSIDSSDSSYERVLEAVLKTMPHDEQHSVEMITSHSGPQIASDEVGDVTAGGTILWAFDGVKESILRVDGYDVKVIIVDAESDNKLTTKRDRYVRFVSPSMEARHALHRWLIDAVVAKSGDVRPVMRIAASWGNWNTRGDLPRRSLDSVVLSGTTKEDLVGDLARFRDLEDAYVKLGVPYHRSYLLHGPPGTGKTSLVKAVANEFKMPLFFIPLSDIDNDTSLLNLVSSVPPRSMLLLEDIDIASTATEQSDDTTQKHASLSSLLNALDGVFTPHGLVTVMTTNAKERLDDRLLRPGRVDVDLYVGMLDADQIDGIWRMSYSEGAPQEVVDVFVDRSPASLVGLITRFIDDPRGAVAESEYQAASSFTM